MDNFWLGFIIAVAAAAATLIPLGVALYKKMKGAVETNDWVPVMSLVISLMADAKERFEHGSDKKEWVLGQLRVIAQEMNYNLDEEAVSKLIDSICDLGKYLYEENPA